MHNRMVQPPATSQDPIRAAVTAALLHTFDRGSVVGTYSIDVHGDTTNTLYGAYRVENKDLVRGQAIVTGATG